MVPALIISLYLPDMNKQTIKYPIIVFLVVLGNELLNNSIGILAKVVFTEYEGYTNYSLGFATNFIIISFLVMIIGDLIRNRKMGFYIVTAIFTVLSTINYFVVSFTNQSVTVSDLFKAQTAMSVAGQLVITPKLIIGYITGLSVFIISFFVIHSIKEQERQPAIICFFRDFIAGGLVVFLVTVCFSTLLKFNTGQAYGFVTHLVVTSESSFKKPSVMVDYNDVKEKYSTEKIKNKRPNVIIIMSEAFSDINYIYEKNEDVAKKLNIPDIMPYYKKLCKESTSGVAYSSVCGNNTVTSEFEFLTGASSMFSAEGAEMWRKYVSEETWSIVDDFNHNNYNTYGIHPAEGYNYNRRSAWEKLGFADISFIEDMPNLSSYRGLATDLDNYKQIIKKYEENKSSGKGFFCFNVSMQNHGPYLADIGQGFDNVKLNSKQTNSIIEAQNYLTLMKETDKSLEYLINYFKNVNEDTVIMLFGDHEPIFIKDLYKDTVGAEPSSVNENSIFYKVPYVVWSNNNNKQEQCTNETSINYLSTYLYDTAQITKPKFLQFTSDLQKEFPVITANFAKDSDGKVYDAAQISDAIKKLKNKKSKYYPLKVYQCWTYDLINSGR